MKTPGKRTFTTGYARLHCCLLHSRHAMYYNTIRTRHGQSGNKALRGEDIRDLPQQAVPKMLRILWQYSSKGLPQCLHY